MEADDYNPEEPGNDLNLRLRGARLEDRNHKKSVTPKQVKTQS